ncbi:MAG TPA: Rad52/Rad22 family DNA repair protein, partial [Methylomirabilota bacterium]
MNLKKLAEPFREDEYEWRVGQCGVGKNGPWAKVLCYVTARAIMDRLDDVCGPDRWRVSYTHEADGVMCHLEILCESGWVSKSDGAPKTEIEPMKG